MSKIDTDGYFASARRRDLRRDGRGRRVDGGSRVFTSLFSEATTEETGGGLLPGSAIDSNGSDIQVEELLDTVHELGERLKKDPGRQALLDYKEAVKKLLGLVVRNGLDVREYVSGHNIMKRKRFSLVTVIDERLQRLGVGVLQSQRDQMEILRRVDEIHGLLVDLLR